MNDAIDLNEFFKDLPDAEFYQALDEQSKLIWAIYGCYIKIYAKLYPVIDRESDELFTEFDKYYNRLLKLDRERSSKE